MPSFFLGLTVMEAMMSVARMPSLLLSLGVLTLSPLFAQTTPTECAAAREIVQEIEALQARLNPTAMGQRLANGNDRARGGNRTGGIHGDKLDSGSSESLRHSC